METHSLPFIYHGRDVLMGIVSGEDVGFLDQVRTLSEWLTFPVRREGDGTGKFEIFVLFLLHSTIMYHASNIYFLI